MRRILFALISVLISTMSFGQGIKFERSLTWEELLTKAKNENKYIFIDCYATWCGPCKEMDKYTFTDKNVGDFFNSHFLSFKMQMDSTKNDDQYIRNWRQGVKLVNALYEPKAYPTFLFFNPNGEIVHRAAGLLYGPLFIQIGQDALNPMKQYYTLLKQFTEGLRSDTSALSLAKLMRDAIGNTEACVFANDYIKALSDKELLSSGNIGLLYEFTRTTKDKGFYFFKKYRKEIESIDKSVDQKMISSFLSRLIYQDAIKPYEGSNRSKPDWRKINVAVEKFGSLGKISLKTYKPTIIFNKEIKPELQSGSNWEETLKLIKNQSAGEGEEYLVGSTVVFYINQINRKQANDLTNFMLAAKYYKSSYPSNLKPSARNSWGWFIFKHSNKLDELEEAISWIKEGINQIPEDDLNTKALITDTYANLLYKSGQRSQALEWEEKAIAYEEKLALSEGRKPNPVFRETLEKIKAKIPTW